MCGAGAGPAGAHAPVSITPPASHALDCASLFTAVTVLAPVEGAWHVARGDRPGAGRWRQPAGRRSGAPPQPQGEKGGAAQRMLMHRRKGKKKASQVLFCIPGGAFNIAASGVCLLSVLRCVYSMYVCRGSVFHHRGCPLLDHATPGRCCFTARRYSLSGTLYLDSMGSGSTKAMGQSEAGAWKS